MSLSDALMGLSLAKSRPELDKACKAVDAEVEKIVETKLELLLDKLRELK